MSSDEEYVKPKRKLRQKQKDNDGDFLKKPKPAGDAPKRRRKVKRGKSPKRGGDENEENEKPLLDKDNGNKKKKNNKKKSGEEESDSDSDIERGDKDEKRLSGNLFKKFKSKSKKKTPGDKDEDEDGSDGDKKPRKVGRARNKRPLRKKSSESGDDNTDDDDDDAPKRITPSVSMQEFSFFGLRFHWVSSGGANTTVVRRRPYKVPRPGFYKRWLKNSTFPFGVGLRPMPSVGKGDDAKASRPLPKNYAGSQPDDVISILITAMENLVDDPIVVHPLVRIHCVDVMTGRYLERVKRKGQKFESATTQFEKQTVLPTGTNKKRQPNKKCTFLPPVCTLPWRLSGVRGANPQWQEQVHILESYTTLLSDKALLLFEILDFGPTVPIEEARKGEGYYRIAWGFLKTRGANGQLRVGVRQLPKGAKPDLNKEYSDYAADLAPSQKVCRLQLFKYQEDTSFVKEQAYHRGLPAFVNPPATPEVPRVYLQYLRQRRIPYKSSLTVIIGPVSKPRTQIVLRRPNAPWEQEKHRLKFQQLAVESVAEGGGGELGGVRMDAARAEVVRRGAMLRARKPTEQCIVPNKLLHRLHGGDQGALSISFNNSGSILAVACSNNDVTFPIRLYDTESGMLRHEFVGHHSLVYDLKFSMNDKYLVSASADGTSKVFCMGGLSSNKRGSDEGELEDGADEEDEDGEEGDDQEEEEEEDASSLMGKKKKRAKKGKDKDKDGETLRGSPFLMSTLQHNPPVYLYCATFQPPAPSAKGNDNSAPLVLTGSFDSAIRLWNPTTGSNLGLTGGKRYHESNVNAMVFDHKTGRLYSGDGEGCIIIWRKQGQGKAGTDYAVMRKIDKLKELKGVPITSLALDPSRPTGRGQILIMGHNNTMKVFDLSTQRLTSSSYAGADNHKSIVRASYSACGKYVVAGSDQGTLMVWDAKTGLKINSSLDYVIYASPINGVVWHPTQHIVAVCCYGGPYPVLLYSADRDPTKHTVAIVSGEGGEGGEGVVGEGGGEGDNVEAEERRVKLEEKRKANRARYNELRDKALARRQGIGGDDDNA